MFVAHVAAEYARVRAPAARVRLGARERPVRGARAAVRADAHEGLSERRAQVVLAHHEVDGAGLPPVCRDDVEERVQLVLALLLRYLGDALALKRLQLAVDHRAYQHARRAAATEVYVLPLVRVLKDVGLDARARRGGCD